MAEMRHNGDLRRDPALARLLAETPTPEVLPWSKVERIVAEAPPAARPWHAFITDPLTSGVSALRYSAAGAAVVVVAVGVLAVVPAQSDHVGTIVAAQLPASWEPGGVELSEVRVTAQQEYDAAVGEAGRLYFLSTERDGRPQLTLALEHMNSADATALFESLVARYPALGAFEPELSPIAGERQSVLAGLLDRMLRPAELSGLDESAARLRILQTLEKLGLRPTAVSSYRDENGNLIISVDAELEIQVEGHTQEALESAGLGRDFLGGGLD